MKILKGLLVLIVFVVALALFGIWYIGAWNILFPSSEHDTVAPTLPTSLTTPALLVFSKTNSFRHADGIAGGEKALRELASKQNLSTFFTENGAVFNARDLALFDAVIFLNATGDMLNSEQEAAFAQWMESGGSWLGIHAAGDGSHAGWEWYRDNLIGADFTAHTMGPHFQSAKVVLENTTHPVLRGLPDTWQHTEEWYSWEKSPREEGFTILATLDEDSYSPVQIIFGNETDLSMGDHPVVWGNCVGEGRSVYMAMGHAAEAYEQAQVKRLLGNAVAWLRAEGDCEKAALGE